MSETVPVKPINPALKLAALGLLVLAIGEGGYVVGMHLTAKSSIVASNGTAPGGFGSNSGRGGHRFGGFGTVAAISATSITVNNERSGNSTEYAITSTTIVKNNGATGAVTDIKIGDTVIVRTSSTDTKTATAITLNPTMRGFGGTGTPGAGTGNGSSNSGSAATDTTLQ